MQPSFNPVSPWPGCLPISSSEEVCRTGQRRMIRPWKIAVAGRLLELTRLAPGWDGYQGVAVATRTAEFAMQLLTAICQPDTPAPQIVPGPSGDLQLEWHTAVGDLELWIRGPGDVHAWSELHATGDAEELDVTTDFQVLARWVQRVAESAHAGPAAT